MHASIHRDRGTTWSLLTVSEKQHRWKVKWKPNRENVTNRTAQTKRSTESHLQRKQEVDLDSTLIRTTMASCVRYRRRCCYLTVSSMVEEVRQNDTPIRACPTCISMPLCDSGVTSNQQLQLPLPLRVAPRSSEDTSYPFWVRSSDF